MIVLINTIDNIEIKYKTIYSSGFDINSAVDITVQPLETVLISTGLYIKEANSQIIINNIEFIPELQIRPRSGLSSKGILVHFGTVDVDYRGEIKVILTNLTDKPFQINKGMRIAQGVFSLTCRWGQIKVENNQRGEGGFGSTGL